MIRGPALYLALVSLRLIRGNGRGSFCAKVFCGFENSRVGNHPDHQSRPPISALAYPLDGLPGASIRA